MPAKPKYAKPGQPTKYRPEYCDKIIEYFDQPSTKIIEKETFTSKGKKMKIKEEVPNDLPLFGMFAFECGVHIDTLHQWKATYPEFSEAYKRAKEKQQEILMNNMLSGRYNSPGAIFTAKNVLGWRDKKEVALEGPVKVVIDSGDSKL